MQWKMEFGHCYEKEFKIWLMKNEIMKQSVDISIFFYFELSQMYHTLIPILYLKWKTKIDLEFVGW